MTSLKVWEDTASTVYGSVPQCYVDCTGELYGDVQCIRSPALYTPTWSTQYNVEKNAVMHSTMVPQDLQANWNTGNEFNGFELAFGDNNHSVDLDENIISLLECLDDYTCDSIENISSYPYSSNQTNLGFHSIESCSHQTVNEDRVAGQRTDHETKLQLDSKIREEYGLFPDQTSLDTPIQRSRKKLKDRKVEQLKKRRTIYLWKFLAELLADSKFSNCIRWISQVDGVFSMVDSEAVAKMWGKRKKRENMTYEKMSRAMRYYYHRKILERVPKQRLMYKFGAKAMKEINQRI